MFTRRFFLQSLTLMASGVYISHANGKTQTKIDSGNWYMPDESAPHKRTWMSFIASYDIWEDRQVSEVQRNLAEIARSIAKYEPVSLLVRKQDYATAVKLLNGLDSHPYPIELIEFTMDDLWMRDTGPAFVVNGKGQKSAVNFNFNGWGEDQAYEQDAKVADFVALTAGVKSIQSNLILEGGCFELDGAGTAIMTESCILNDNRNPGKGKVEVENELKTLLGLEKIIWLKGIKGKDITDGHTDFYARFIRPGVVAVSRDMDSSSYDYQITRENIEILKSSSDANGNAFELIVLDTPWDINTQFGTKDFAAGYVGYYVCNGAIIMQKFGDKQADSAARQKLARAFPNHQIEQIAIDGIASGGGSIHCATQQEPLAE
ncbi:agmatine/peptidylarginine deiminase [Motiliproteus sp. MSK22-1]|uniref:agmatine deiminase family protein n=1 Tax=Motiliproteus sp. MSK22-1 TaxID=1897630 RepID=UPI0009788CBC|nr:agmatine deiminase family protein [Motiliproteus sp. MSK22-1]OMH31727.1 agmatine deiminase [Motiliproteus sp. MSK22-1]